MANDWFRQEETLDGLHSNVAYWLRIQPVNTGRHLPAPVQRGTRSSIRKLFSTAAPWIKALRRFRAECP